MIDDEIEKLISEVVEEATSEAMEEAAKALKKAEAARIAADKERERLERKAAQERKEYGQAIEAALRLQSETLATATKKAAEVTAQALGQIVTALKTSEKEEPEAKPLKFEFDIVRDSQGRLLTITATQVL